MGLLDRVRATLGVGEPLDGEAREALTAAVGQAERGELAAAEEQLADLAGRAPRSLPLLVALGEVRARRGDDEGAVTAFGRAVDVSGDSVDAWLGLGEALARLGRADPARDAFRRVLSAAGDPGRRARAHAGRGRLALSAGRTAKAVRELRKAAELFPTDLAICADLGRALMVARDPEGWQWLLRAAQGAMALALAGEETAPPDVALVIEAARASPKPGAAVALLRSALARAALLSERERARLTAALGREVAEAAEALDAGTLDDALAAEIAGDEPGDAGAEAARPRLVRAAQDLGTKALTLAPDDPGVLESWQVIAEVAGDARSALEAAERAAVRGAPPPGPVLVRLALAAQDREALTRAAAVLPADHPLGAALRAFLDHRAGEEDLVSLGALTRGTADGVPLAGATRRFVAEALSPGLPPEGNLYALLEYARDLAGRNAELAPLLAPAARAAEAFDRPLLVAVMGEFNAGKSSFVNAFCGAEVAPVGVTPTTATVNVLRYGPPGGRVLFHDGRAEDLSAEAVSPFLAALDAEQAAAVRLVEIFFPLDVLRQVEMVDTPGLNSLRPEHERVARDFLTEADAILWLFSVGQAAKASEGEALDLAQGAGKRVVGVLNKADQADAAELAQVTAHVHAAIGPRIEVLLPLSARNALRARLRGDQRLLAASGLPALLAMLEERFFNDARALKRRTAMASLARFASEARRLLAAGDPAVEPREGTFAARRQALEAAQVALAGALAAERVGLRARLERSFRQAAAEVLEFVRPRRWPFGERRAEAADEDFLFDLLDDAVAQGTEATRRALAEAATGPAIPIAGTIERFRAYVRGVLAGGLVERFLHEELPAAGGRVELAALQRALARRMPDLDGELFTPLAAEIDAAHARARAALDEEELRAAMRALVREARVLRPLAGLDRAAAGLPA